MTQKTVNQSIGNFTDNVDDYIEKLREANQIEPLIIKGRPFTPDDLQHLDELNEKILKKNPPKPYQWTPRMIPQTPWEIMYARYFGRPIILDDPRTSKNQKA